MAYSKNNFTASKNRQYMSQEVQRREIIESTADWIITRVGSNLGLVILDERMENFRNEIIKLLKQKFSISGCANLRTTKADTDFILLAKKCDIPQEALPKDTSIVVKHDLAYYTVFPSRSQHIIRSFI